MPDCWLEVSIRKVLRPATSTQVFLGFPVSTSEIALKMQIVGKFVFLVNTFEISASETCACFE